MPSCLEPSLPSELVNHKSKSAGVDSLFFNVFSTLNSSGVGSYLTIKKKNIKNKIYQ